MCVCVWLFGFFLPVNEVVGFHEQIKKNQQDLGGVLPVQSSLLSVLAFVELASFEREQKNKQ